MRLVSQSGLGAVAAALAFAVPAGAQVTFIGSTQGCFFSTSASTCSTLNSTTSGGLSFAAGTFNVTSANGTVAIGNVPGSTNNLGTITSGSNTSLLAGDRFLMRVTFTSPSGTTPGSQLFTADLLGSIVNGQGGVRFVFPSTEQVFTYTGGTFTLVVDPQSVSANSTVALSGFIRVSQATTVPEPSSYLLMAGGLAGLGFVGYRRRQRA